MPLGVKLHACLLLLGFSDDDIAAGIEWDHHPALAFREIINGVMVPAPNDPRFIRPLRRTEHREKTSGRKTTSAGSDIHMAAKIKRITGHTPKPKSRKIQSRGFAKSGKKK